MPKKSKLPTLHRQGDVLIRKVAALPSATKPVPREAGRIVLAHGEATGHSHAIAAEGCALLEAPDGRRFLDVQAPAKVEHEEHGAIALDEGTYEVIRQLEYQPEEVRRVAD